MSSFRLSIQDNDSYAFREYPKLTEYQRIHQALTPDMSGRARPGIRRCEACNELIDKWNESLDGLIVRKRKFDISCTYDGLDVVSQRFIDTYEQASLVGLVFRQLPDDPAFFAIQAKRIVQYDSDRRKTKFAKQCPVCGKYESVTGATPVFLKPKQTIDDLEFVRTDIEFGSDDEKSPLILCGKQAGKALSQARIKGLELVPIANDQ